MILDHIFSIFILSYEFSYIQDIVAKHEKEKRARERVENNKVKFGCIAAAADVLSGKLPLYA